MARADFAGEKPLQQRTNAWRIRALNEARADTLMTASGGSMQSLRACRLIDSRAEDYT
jgi:hypothetical protein